MTIVLFRVKVITSSMQWSVAKRDKKNRNKYLIEE
jgi:hypothetical protein